MSPKKATGKAVQARISEEFLRLLKENNEVVKDNNRIGRENNLLLKDIKEMLRKMVINTS